MTLSRRTRAPIPCLVMLSILGCSHRMHVKSGSELVGMKVWVEPAGEQMMVVVRLPRPEGVQSPRVSSLDEPFDFRRKDLDGATEIRFPVAKDRLSARKSIRLSVAYGGPPSTVLLEGPVRFPGAAAANLLFWSVISGI